MTLSSPSLQNKQKPMCRRWLVVRSLQQPFWWHRLRLWSILSPADVQQPRESLRKYSAFSPPCCDCLLHHHQASYQPWTGMCILLFDGVQNPGLTPEICLSRSGIPYHSLILYCTDVHALNWSIKGSFSASTHRALLRCSQGDVCLERGALVHTVAVKRQGVAAAPPGGLPSGADPPKDCLCTGAGLI